MNHQVVILAAGESSRFFPLNGLHKSFFEIAGKTIIERTVESAKKTNPKDIIIVLGAKNFDEEKKICEGNKIFDGVIYVRQDSPLGGADAILATESHITENFFVLNPQHFEFHEVADTFLSKFDSGDYIAVLGSIETTEPERYGILSIEGDRVVGLVEKPEKGTEPSNMKVVGTYLFEKSVIEELKRAEPTQYLLENVLDILAKQGKVGSVDIKSNPPTLKYPWDVLDIKDDILSKLESHTDSEAIIEKTAVIRGDGVFIGKNAHICDFSIIEGPAYIGENAVVGSYSQIRKGSVLEKDSQAERYCDIRNSLIGQGTHIHSGFVGDSIIGKHGRIGAEFITANKRLDRKSVTLTLNGSKVDTGKINLGAALGDNIKVGIRVSTMPGVLVGSDSNIFPGIILKGTYDKGSKISG